MLTASAILTAFLAVTLDEAKFQIVRMAVMVVDCMPLAAFMNVLLRLGILNENHGPFELAALWLGVITGVYARGAVV
ncbi:MAG: hypothetical protein ACPGRX_00960 [Bdellovibrionales bacterium]